MSKCINARLSGILKAKTVSISQVGSLNKFLESSSIAAASVLCDIPTAKTLLLKLSTSPPSI